MKQLIVAYDRCQVLKGSIQLQLELENVGLLLFFARTERHRRLLLTSNAWAILVAEYRAGFIMRLQENFKHPASFVAEHACVKRLIINRKEISAENPSQSQNTIDMFS